MEEEGGLELDQVKKSVDVVRGEGDGHQKFIRERGNNSDSKGNISIVEIADIKRSRNLKIRSRENYPHYLL